MIDVVFPSPKILIVDDHAPNRLALRRLLAKSGAELIEAESGNAALAACLDHRFALVLLDVNMPEMDGFEVASLLGDDESSRDTPIIFISAAYDDLNRLKGYGSGGVDYIAKPVNDVILRSKVHVFLELYRRREELRLALSQLSVHTRELEQEIELRRQVEAKVWHQASHDGLTSLPNRTLFMDRMERAIERGIRHARPFALCYIDIDGFKPVNDAHGHHAGDQLLKEIATRLRLQVRSEDTVARLGGDEFAIILEEMIDTPAAALRICQEVCDALGQPYRLNMAEGPLDVTIGASFGIALFPEHGSSCDPLVLAADQAMYRAKRGGKNRCALAHTTPAGTPSDPPTG